MNAEQPAMPPQRRLRLRNLGAAAVFLAVLLPVALPLLQTERPAAENFKPPPPPTCQPDDYTGCKKGCEAGAGDACQALAYMLLVGHDARQDLRAGVKAFEKACQLGSAHSCTAAASTILLHLDPNDFSTAATLYGKGCDSGDQEACIQFAWHLETGKGIERDIPRAHLLYRRLCDDRQGFGCTKLGHLQEETDGGSRAAEFYRRGCDLGDAESCYALAQALQDGVGVARNTEQARSFFARACDLDLDKACDEIGMVHPAAAEREARHAVHKRQRDSREAELVEQQQSCANGLLKDCYFAGESLVDGLLVGGHLDRSVDFDRGIALLKRSCNGGFGPACSSLARIYEKGEGFGLNPAEAARFLELACTMGVATACRP